MIQAACYIRVSTEEQTENYSIDEQKSRLKAYCTAKDWTIYKFYTDGGYSGSNINRPALKQLISDILSKHVNLVLVYKLDRLSRSQKDTLYLIEDIFLKNNTEFVSVNESLDTLTPYGRAMIGILSAFAQLEREQIKERMTMGRTARAKEGKFHGGAYSPIGYDYIDGKLIVNEYEAQQIREIFKLYIRGESIHSIQRQIHKKYSNKYSGWSSYISILNCLKNNIYTGKIKFNGKIYNGAHEPIISEEIYNTAQRLLQNKKSAYNSAHKAGALLSSLLICGNCGAKFYSDHGKYTCYSRGKASSKFITDPNCKMKKWNMEELNTIIKNEIKKLNFNIKLFGDTLNEYNLNINDNYMVIKKRITEIEKQIDRIIELYKTGCISKERISPKINALQSEKNILISNTAFLNKELSSQKANKQNKNIHILDTKSIAEQRMFVNSLIDKIIIYDDTIKIFWSF